MKKLIVVLIGLLFTGQVMAADGSSGCGPGWYVFKNNSLVSSSLRATTNGILMPLQTLGMTFGTSNCSKHSIVKNEKRSLHLATMSYFELQADIAKGSGEHLAAFASTLGCSPSELGYVGLQFQKNYSTIYPDSQINPERALSEAYKVIFRDKHLINRCAMTIG